MYKLKINTQLGTFEGIDTKEVYLPIFGIIDEDNPYQELELLIETTEPQSLDYIYPHTSLLMFNISPSITLENDFSPLTLEVSIQNSENFLVINDKRAFDGYGVVGVIFSSDYDLIVNFENSDILKRKFILVPYKLAANSVYSIKLKIYRSTEEAQASIVRNKFYGYEKIIYDFSKSYSGALESINNISLAEFYETYGRERSFLVINKEALLNKVFYPKDFLYTHLATNSTIVLDDGSLDSFILNYEKNFLSDYRIEASAASKFPYLKFSNTINTLVGTYENISINTENYLKEVSNLVFAEILKPYILNSGFFPINTEHNIKLLASFLERILQQLITLTTVRETIVNYTTFSGDLLPQEKQKLWFSILYLESVFFIDFVNGLLHKGYISQIPAEVLSLKDVLDSYFQTFLDFSYFLNSLSLIEQDTLDTDFIMSLFFAVYLYHLSGKNILPSGSSLVKYLEIFYDYYMKASEFLFSVKTNLNPNKFINDSSVSIETVSNKALLLSLYSSLFGREEFYIDLLNRLNAYGVNNITIEETTEYYKISIELSSLSSGSRQYLYSSNTVILYPGSGNDENFYGKNVVLANSSLNEHYMFLPFSIFSTEIIGNNLVLRVSKRNFIINEEQKLVPRFTTLDLSANMINLYTKINALLIDNNYFISSGGNNQIEAITNTFVYEYLKFLLSGNLNNKVSQNTTNIKIILTNTFWKGYTKM